MDKIIARIKALLETHVASYRGIKVVHWGDNIYIPQSDLPAILVVPSKTSVLVGDNMRDVDNFTVEISVVLDARQYIDKSPDEVSAFRELVAIMEDREQTSNKVKSNTVLGVIRQQMYDDSNYVYKNDSILINYGVSDSRNYPTFEGVLSVVFYSQFYSRV